MDTNIKRMMELSGIKWPELDASFDADRNEFTVVDSLTYDGALDGHNYVGFGKTEEEATNNWVEQVLGKGLYSDDVIAQLREAAPTTSKVVKPSIYATYDPDRGEFAAVDSITYDGLPDGNNIVGFGDTAKDATNDWVEKALGSRLYPDDVIAQLRETDDAPPVAKPAETPAVSESESEQFYRGALVDLDKRIGGGQATFVEYSPSGSFATILMPDQNYEYVHLSDISLAEDPYDDDDIDESSTSSNIHWEKCPNCGENYCGNGVDLCVDCEASHKSKDLEFIKKSVADLQPKTESLGDFTDAPELEFDSVDDTAVANQEQQASDLDKKIADIVSFWPDMYDYQKLYSLPMPVIDKIYAKYQKEMSESVNEAEVVPFASEKGKVVLPDGTVEYFDDKNQYHRIGGPALAYPNGTEYWYRHGILHRPDGPAVVYSSGGEYWYFNGAEHRENGPAIITPSGKTGWYLNGKEYSFQEYCQELGLDNSAINALRLKYIDNPSQVRKNNDAAIAADNKVDRKSAGAYRISHEDFLDKFFTSANAKQICKILNCPDLETAIDYFEDTTETEEVDNFLKKLKPVTKSLYTWDEDNEEYVTSLKVVEDFEDSVALPDEKFKTGDDAVLDAMISDIVDFYPEKYTFDMLYKMPKSSIERLHAKVHKEMSEGAGSSAPACKHGKGFKCPICYPTKVTEDGCCDEEPVEVFFVMHGADEDSSIEMMTPESLAEFVDLMKRSNVVPEVKIVKSKADQLEEVSLEDYFPNAADQNITKFSHPRMGDNPMKIAEDDSIESAKNEIKQLQQQIKDIRAEQQYADGPAHSQDSDRINKLYDKIRELEQSSGLGAQRDAEAATDKTNLFSQVKQELDQFAKTGSFPEEAGVSADSKPIFTLHANRVLTDSERHALTSAMKRRGFQVDLTNIRDIWEGIVVRLPKYDDSKKQAAASSIAYEALNNEIAKFPNLKLKR